MVRALPCGLAMETMPLTMPKSGDLNCGDVRYDTCVWTVNVAPESREIQRPEAPRATM